MAINYGTTTPLEPLDPNAIASYYGEPEKKESDWTDFVFSSSFLKGIVIILELGLSFFPPAKLAGTAAQIGIGLGAAALTTTIDAVNNNLSYASIAIDFSTAFIPLAAAKITKFKNLRKVKKGVTKLIEKKPEFVKAIEAGKEVYIRQMTKNIAKVKKAGSKFAAKIDDLTNPQLKSIDKFSKFLLNPKKAKTDAAILNFIAPTGALKQAKKQFPELFETILHKSVRDARWSKSAGCWYNFRKTNIKKYGEQFFLLRKGYYAKITKETYAKMQKAAQRLDDLIRAQGTTLQAMSKRITQYSDMILDLQKLGKKALSTKRAFKTAIATISESRQVNKLAIKYVLWSSRKLKITEQAAKSSKVIQSVLNELKDNPQDLERFEALISLVRNVKAKPHLFLEAGYEQIDTFLEPILKELSDDTLIFLHKLNNTKSVWQGSPDQFQEIVDYLGSEIVKATQVSPKPNTWIDKIRYLGSDDFDSKYVQRVQNIFDPRDAGRYFVERVYQKINRIVQTKINKFVETKVVNDAIASAAKAAKTTKVLKTSKGVKAAQTLDAAQKAATKFRVIHKIINGKSRYLSHYQVYGKKGAYYVTLVHFQKKPFLKIKRGKNKGGKKPVWIAATKTELYNIKTIGGTYWKSVAYMRGWEQSRGGRRWRNNISYADRDLSLFLGLVPINPLRRVLSLVSNIVEGSYSMITGNFFNRQWVNKFVSSFSNTLKNRIGRLITRTGAKYAGNRFKGQALRAMQKNIKDYKLSVQKMQSKVNFLARNLQKTGSLLLNNLRFDYELGGQGLQFKSKNYVRKTTSQFFRMYAPTTIRGGLIHKDASIRRNINIRNKQLGLNVQTEKNLARELFSGRRKLGQVGRTWSAITPNKAGGFAKNFRSLTRFKI